MEKWTSGQIAVVTGCSSGIGAAIAVDLVKAGVIVVGLARRVERIEALQNDLKGAKGKLHAFGCDVSDLESIKKAFQWIEKTFGKVNILVNNAGVARVTKLLAPGDEVAAKLKEVVDTNVLGLVNCTREAFRLMQNHDEFGYIININSIAGHQVTFATSLNIYSGSKFAVTATTAVMRNEIIGLENKKIRVSSVSPGLVSTEIFEVSNPGPSQLRAAIDNKLIPYLEPEDVSNAVMYLLGTPSTVNITELTIQATGEKF